MSPGGSCGGRHPSPAVGRPRSPSADAATGCGYSGRPLALPPPFAGDGPTLCPRTSPSLGL
eukprot:6261199-Alexandrium_andersonii.AAC.1